LIFYKKSLGRIGLTLEEAVEEAISFGWIDVKLKKVNDERYILRFTPRKANSVWSKINKERAEKIIASGRMTNAGLVKIEEAKKSGNWNNAYSSLVKEEILSDLEEALMKDKKAWYNFERFANSYRNMYISWVNAARTNETRQERIKKVVENSLENRKLIS
jgi:uncharacterized protein YdeI (YjbR/CyaY-like superfamily)